MKQLKLTAAASVLTLALSFSAFAGDIGTMLISPAPTQSTATATSTPSTTIAVDPVTQLILVLLNLLP